MFYDKYNNGNLLHPHAQANGAQIHLVTRRRYDLSDPSADVDKLSCKGVIRDDAAAYFVEDKDDILL